MRTVLSCRPSRELKGHEYDSASGWCRHGCGVRDDGFVLSQAGDRLRYPTERPDYGRLADP